MYRVSLFAAKNTNKTYVVKCPHIMGEEEPAYRNSNAQHQIADSVATAQIHSLSRWWTPVLFCHKKKQLRGDHERGLVWHESELTHTRENDTKHFENDDLSLLHRR